MGGTCADIEGTVQAIEGSKAYKVRFWSNTKDFLGHCLGQGMIWLQDVNVPVLCDVLLLCRIITSMWNISKRRKM